MVNMKVEVISRETIKPSSPTPSHLRIFKRSLLDQISPRIYVPIIFFYPMSDAHLKNIKQTSTCLKESLSETLSRFFPLAGRIRDHLSINCNDEGALFSEARVSCQLSDFLSKQPKLDLVDQFLPCSQFCTVPVDEAVQVAIQLNVFAYGGIAIGVCFFHKTTDGATMGAFLKCWGAIASGCHDKAVYPDYSTASQLYPPRESPHDDVSLLEQSWLVKEGKAIRRRFVFYAAAISALQAKVTSTSDFVPNPSRVLAVSAFIWKCAMAASIVALGSKQCLEPNDTRKQQQPSAAFFSVNMRQRMDQPLSQYSFGNMVWQAIALCKASEETTELHSLVSLLRGAVSKINGDRTKSLQGTEGFQAITKFKEEMGELFSTENPDPYIFTSWCKFGFNELDFGWGKPIWVGSTGSEHYPVFENYIMLVESAGGCGDGIEAWVCLDEHVMAILERDTEFLKFASLNPSILLPAVME